MKETRKQLVRRCPRLGGPVAFSYCTACEADNRPCGKIIDCWWEVFDVVRYLEDTLTPQEFERVVRAKPPPKLCQLVDMIARSKRRLEES